MRARQRLAFLVKMPKIRKQDAIRDLSGILDKTEIDTFYSLYTTSNQTDTAKKLNCGQPCICQRSKKILEKLNQQTEPKYQKYAFVLDSFINDIRFNILKEIELPKWAHKNNSYSDKINLHEYGKLTAPVQVNDQVLITSGKYKNLQATVSDLSLEDKTADVTLYFNALRINIPKLAFTNFSRVTNENVRDIYVQEQIFETLKNKKTIRRDKLIEKLAIDPKTVEKQLKCLINRKEIEAVSKKKYKHIVYNY